ncbi:MAG: GxxExxY protein [Bacteroidales bacterium]
MNQHNKISYDIRGATFKVLKKLGPGMLESVYESALAYELKKMGHTVKTQIPVPMKYEDIEMNVGFRLDILVDDLVIVEVKSVENLSDIHHKQLLTYLKLSEKKLGLLINFNCTDLTNNIIRIVNGLDGN